MLAPRASFGRGGPRAGALRRARTGGGHHHLGKTESVTDPSNDQTLLTYYPGTGLLETLTNPRGNTYSFNYDFTTGRLLKDADPAGGFKTLSLAQDTTTPTTSGYTVSVATAGGRTTTHHLVQVQNGDQTRTSITSGMVSTLVTHQNGGQLATSADSTTVTTTEAGDSRFGLQAPITSNLTTVTPVNKLTASVASTRTVTLSNPNNVLSLTSLNETTQLNSHPAATRAFNASTKTWTLTSPAGRKVTELVDSLGRPSTVTVGNLLPVKLAYYATGSLESMTQGTRTVSYTYDPTTNYLESVTDALGNVTTFGHDAIGRVTSVTLPSTALASFGPDPDSNLVSVTPPGKLAHDFAYTPVDLMASYTPPAVDATPTTTSYTYNVDRLLTSATRPDNTVVTFTNDPATGRLTAVAMPSGHGTIGYSYNATTGKLTSVSGPMGANLAYGYDGKLVTSRTWTGTVVGAVTRTFNNDFRIATESVSAASGGTSESFAYDNDGLLTTAGALSIASDATDGLFSGSTLGTITDAVTRDAYGAPATYSATAGTTALWNITYTPDAAGRIHQMVETVGGVTNTFVYTYDVDGHLTDVSENGSETNHYDYDANGNRIGFTGRGADENRADLRRAGQAYELRRHVVHVHRERRAAHEERWGPNHDV